MSGSWRKFQAYPPMMAGFFLLQSLCSCSVLSSLPLSGTTTEKSSGSSTSPVQPAVPATGTGSDNGSESNEEQALFRLVNSYRAERKLPEVPQSAKLMLTAKTHARDLNINSPQLQKASDGSQCNLHSWSAKGSWQPVCYTPDHREAEKMWSKPREVAKYGGNGYEISLQAGSCQKAECLLEIWKNSPGHNQLLVNEGIWADSTWRAMGVGISGQFANIWFGKEAD